MVHYCDGKPKVVEQVDRTRRTVLGNSHVLFNQWLAFNKGSRMKASFDKLSQAHGDKVRKEIRVTGGASGSVLDGVERLRQALQQHTNRSRADAAAALTASVTHPRASCTSLHLCEFGPGFLQNRDIGIGIFPECKKILVSCFCPGLIS